MCGIFALLCRNFASKYKLKDINEQMWRIKHRGPDATAALSLTPNVFFGFHRLAINDLSPKGMQPFQYKDYYVICNGQIYNHKALTQKYRIPRTSNMDCEVIPHLYEQYQNIHDVAKELDGVFAFTLYDAKKDVLYVARDPIGVRPLFMGTDSEKGATIFASEAKSMTQLAKEIKQFPPGSVWSSENGTFEKYWEASSPPSSDVIDNEEDALAMIREYLTKACQKRLMGERSIGCFLSGGLDSSLITALVCRYNKRLPNTYSIGMKGATDLYYAEKVAEYLKVPNHQTVIFTPEQGIDCIEKVIYHLESYDITTIRASVGMYLLSQYIADNSEDVVIYSGEGSDEVAQGYLYFHLQKCPDTTAKDSIRLIDNLHHFDVKRADRMTTAHGLEARVPFLDKQFVHKYLQIRQDLRNPNYKGIEKYLIRKAFQGYLPDSVLWRTKEAFSDGVSSTSKPWHVLLQQHIDKMITDSEFQQQRNKYSQNPPSTKEALFYRKIYDKFYSPHNLTPYYWLPQWSNATDPSARTLSHYSKLIKTD